MNFKNYVLAFIVGSSLLAFGSFFIGFNSVQDYIFPDNCLKNMSKYPFEDMYFTYTIFAPIYLGTLSMLAVFIHDYFKITMNMSFLITGIISSMLVSGFITLCHIYKYPRKRLVEQYFRLLIYHGIVFNFIISPIYQYLI